MREDDFTVLRKNMSNARKYIGLIVITILALTSLVFAESVKIKGDVAGFDSSTQTMSVSTSEGVVQLNLAGSVMKRNGTGILSEDFLIGQRVSGTYDPTMMNAIQLNAWGVFDERYVRTKITLDRVAADLRALEGANVVANYGQNGYASSIIATTQKNLDVCNGNIVSIKVKDDIVPLIELVVKTTEYSHFLVFDLLLAEVWKNGKRAKGFDIKAGDFATILYDELRMDIVRIEAWTVTK